MFRLVRSWPRIDYNDAGMVDEIVTGAGADADIGHLRLAIDGLLDLSGADAHPGRRTLWTWLAAWCAGAEAEHQVTVSRIAQFSTRWHETYERQSNPVWLGLAPATAEQLAQLRGSATESGPTPTTVPETTAEPRSTWLDDGERRFEHEVTKHYGSPETITQGGVAALERGDIATGLFFFQKAIDLLHTLYDFSGMRNRRPGEQDSAILALYLRTLADVLRVDPGSDVSRSVVEVTHRLRTIATVCADAGSDPSRYLTALSELGELAPDVDVSGVFWRNPSLREVLGDDLPEGWQ
jgi:hypothetical protein